MLRENNNSVQSTTVAEVKEVIDVNEVKDEPSAWVIMLDKNKSLGLMNNARFICTEHPKHPGFYTREAASKSKKHSTCKIAKLSHAVGV